MRNLLKLAALVTIAVMGAFVIRGLFIAASEPGASSPSVVRVRAAADDLPGGLLLREADLVWKTIPAAQVPAGALVEGEGTGADLKLEGHLLRHAVRAGTPLGPVDLISPTAPGFLAAALKPGMRAISVAVNDVSGNAGLIQPGDYVDVLLTQQLRAEAGVIVPPSHMVESETIAERVRVLAVGSTISRPKEDAAERNINARTVTFEVTPRGAQAITVAAHLGSLSLALRSFAMPDRHSADTDDAAQEPTPPVWAGDVSRALGALPVVRPMPSGAQPGRSANGPSAPQVMVYRGSRAGELHDKAAASGAAGPLAPAVPLPEPAPSAMPAPVAG